MYLAIDTSTSRTSIAVADGRMCLASIELSDVNPGDLAVATIDELLHEAAVVRQDLARIAVGVGPGPYTSTRVGIAIANAIGLGLGIDVVGVCSHDAIPTRLHTDVHSDSHVDFQTDVPQIAEVVVCTDARRREIYWSLYRDGQRILGPTVGKPVDLVQRFPDAEWVGDGLVRYPTLVEQVTKWTPSFPDAALLARIARTAVRAGDELYVGAELSDHGVAGDESALIGRTLFAPRPLYLRRPDAVPPKTVVPAATP